jgi:hypothetical protein
MALRTTGGIVNRHRLILLVAVLVSVFPLRAEIRVSPVAVYLDDSVHYARVFIENKGPEPRHVEIGIVFGYPMSDDQGNVKLRVMEPGESDPSAKSWIRAFPQRFVLAPGEFQMVALIADPPADLPDGEFWARPVISFSSTDPSMSSISGGDEGLANLVLSVNYRHGTVWTGVRLENVSVEEHGQNAVLLLDMQRRGNAAFLGSVKCRLRDEKGGVRQESSQLLAVYRTLRRRVELSTTACEPGRYTVEVEVSTQRESDNPGDIITAPSVLYRSEIVISREALSKGKKSGATAEYTRTGRDNAQRATAQPVRGTPTSAVSAVEPTIARR